MAWQPRCGTEELPPQALASGGSADSGDGRRRGGERLLERLRHAENPTGGSGEKGSSPEDWSTVGRLGQRGTAAWTDGRRWWPMARGGGGGMRYSSGARLGEGLTGGRLGRSYPCEAVTTEE
jgi:hypothetical protein